MARKKRKKERRTQPRSTGRRTAETDEKEQMSGRETDDRAQTKKFSKKNLVTASFIH